MSCYKPLNGFRSRDRNKNGKFYIVFNSRDGYMDMPISVPCGKCIGCRLDNAKQWAIRIMHETQEHEENSFITLTYNEENLPKDLSLHKEHFQKFIKRLRKKLGDKCIRYFHCGEYGSKLQRPHYHAIIFGHDFNDREVRIVEGKTVNVSKMLSELWPYGFTTVGDVTFESASYVARYCTKKVTENKVEHYDIIDKETGEVEFERLPEYTTMSRRPGIGKKYIDKYKKEVYNNDNIIVNGFRCKVPRYYDNQMTPEELGRLKFKRQQRAFEKVDRNNPERLRIKEECATLKLKNLTKRSFEND